MKPNLEKILIKFVGEDRPIKKTTTHEQTWYHTQGYNQALADLRLEIPNLVDEIEKEVVEKLKKKGEVFDTKVFAIPYARQKFDEIITQLNK